MEIAIIGLAQSGKSTLFKIMTGAQGGKPGETLQRGIAKVPDDRFKRLVEVFEPEKVTPAAVPFIDINAAGEKAWNTIRQNIASADVFVHIVEAFNSSDPKEILDKYAKLTDEMIIADLLMIENRIEKLNKLPANILKPEEKLQKDLLPKLKDELEAGKALRNITLSDQEKDAVKFFSFLSIKPEVVVLNISEETKIDDLSEISSPTISVCCKVEEEIAELEEAERREFLESMGIETPAFELVIKTAFSMLGTIYYFTVGKDEVRAWIIREGWKAPKAASVIHKDFERGFIKAEVVSYDDFVATGEDLNKAKAEGKFRLEGKEYVVKNGDIISFRFNV